MSAAVYPLTDGPTRPDHRPHLQVAGKSSAIDLDRAERAVAELLAALGQGPSCEQLAGTRRRVAASYAEPCWRRWAPCSAASLVYHYGFNVETAGDHPVWHKSEADVFPGQYD